jgi:hypothetical protein
MKVTFKEITCQYDLVRAAIQKDISLPVNPSDDDYTVYDKTLVSYPISPDYLVNTNTYRCPFYDCKLLLDCNQASEISPTPSPFELKLITANDTFQVNTDPIWEFDRNLCVQCKNKFYTGGVDSLTFNTKLWCPNTIKVWQPPNLKSQWYYATPDQSLIPTFVFDSFKTQTSACQVYQYSVFGAPDVHLIPFGLDITNPIVETLVLG